MKKFLLFIGGLAALAILVGMIGPMVLLGVSVWLLYIAFKRFMKSDSALGKFAWLVMGLIVLGVAATHLYAVIGLAALYAVYKIFQTLTSSDDPEYEVIDSDPFTNFEKEWKELKQY